MTTAATVTLSAQEKELVLEFLAEYAENLGSMSLDAPISEKLRLPVGALEFAPEEMEIMLDAIDVYGNIFDEQAEPIVQKLVDGLNTLGRTWWPS